VHIAVQFAALLHRVTYKQNIAKHQLCTILLYIITCRVRIENHQRFTAIPYNVSETVHTEM